MRVVGGASGERGGWGFRREWWVGLQVRVVGGASGERDGWDFR